jgi:hypothetical protein
MWSMGFSISLPDLCPACFIQILPGIIPSGGIALTVWKCHSARS